MNAPQGFKIKEEVTLDEICHFLERITEPFTCEGRTYMSHIDHFQIVPIDCFQIVPVGKRYSCIAMYHEVELDQ